MPFLEKSIWYASWKGAYYVETGSQAMYKKFDAFMLKHGFKRSHAQHYLYTKNDEDGSPFILVLYVMICR